MFSDFESNSAPKITIVLKEIDFRRHYKSLSSHIPTNFGVSFTTGSDMVVCINRRGRILRILGRSGNHKLEMNFTSAAGFHKPVVIRPDNQAASQPDQKSGQEDQKPELKTWCITLTELGKAIYHCASLSPTAPMHLA